MASVVCARNAWVGGLFYSLFWTSTVGFIWENCDSFDQVLWRKGTYRNICLKQFYQIGAPLLNTCGSKNSTNFQSSSAACHHRCLSTLQCIERSLSGGTAVHIYDTLEDFTAVNISNVANWLVIPCWLVTDHQHFGRTCCHHVQDRWLLKMEALCSSEMLATAKQRSETTQTTTDQREYRTDA